ncbi:XRE family transcriptional regulator [Zavarzinella formosa]|uniref:XRE family transcriptional regulator n=1 Tax=Zavarzinella formosa TaxID=360055 RepID=UPI000313CC08|nr:XRE family transcriptional regulator [Zavarzinella formosa]
MNKINPEMIVLGRELCGLTQAELATGVSLNQATISRYESGAVEVPDEHIRTIAEFLGRPESFFRWPDQLYGASCMYHRKNRRLSVAELTVIHAKVNLLRIQASRLLKQAKVTSKYSFYRMDQAKLGSPEECARRQRQLWQMPSGPARNVVSSIERAGGMVFRCPFGETRVDGVSQWPLDAPNMPPIFFVHEDIPGDRERLTLSHEVGHVVMHHLPTEGDLEDEANRFAAEFLMPADEIKDELRNLTLPKAAALKSYWKVSMQALIVHAHRLGSITDNQYQYLFRQLSTRGYRTCEPCPIPPEEPEMFKDVVEFHQKKLRWAMSDLSEFLGESEENFRDKYGQNFSNFRLVG